MEVMAEKEVALDGEDKKLIKKILMTSNVFLLRKRDTTILPCFPGFGT